MSSSTGNVKVEGGFNGGGFASHESTGEPGNGGGGATDVRIAQDSLYARIIVAGGGGFQKLADMVVVKSVAQDRGTLH